MKQNLSLAVREARVGIGADTFPWNGKNNARINEFTVWDHRPSSVFTAAQSGL